MDAGQYMQEDSSSADEEDEADGEEAEDRMEDSDWDNLDDTAERIDACGEATSLPPPGYRYAPCPPLASCNGGRAALAQGEALLLPI